MPACSDDDGPEPKKEKEFIDLNNPMEHFAPYEFEKEGSYYNFFRIQNDSDFPIYEHLTTQYYTGTTIYYLLPGMQSTDLHLMEYGPGAKPSDLLTEDLRNLREIRFYFNVPSPENLEQLIGAPPGVKRSINEFKDTCAIYYFTELITSATPNPLDQSQWTVEKFNDHRIRWTYRVTNGDRLEAVRQTLERWKDRPEKQ